MSLIKPFRTTVRFSLISKSLFVLALSSAVSCEPGGKKVAQGQGAEQRASENGQKKTILYHGKLEISLPEELAPMGDEGLAVKYPKARPDFAYAADYGKVTLVFGLKDMPTTPKDIPAIKESIDKKLGQSEAYTSDIKTINGHQYVVAEFISTSEGGKIHNMMFMTDFQGKLLLGTYNFPPETADVWGAKKESILSSVKKI